MTRRWHADGPQENSPRLPARRGAHAAVGARHECIIIVTQTPRLSMAYSLSAALRHYHLPIVKADDDRQHQRQRRAVTELR